MGIVTKRLITLTKFYVDGSGWNGKESKACVTNENGRLLELIITNEKRTNNQMEYQALFTALMLAKNGDTIFTDSRLIIGHLTKNWNINAEHLKMIIETCQKLMKMKNINLAWIPRNKNKAGKVFE